MGSHIDTKTCSELRLPSQVRQTQKGVEHVIIGSIKYEAAKRSKIGRGRVMKNLYTYNLLIHLIKAKTK